jgi:hypothetical protein
VGLSSATARQRGLEIVEEDERARLVGVIRHGDVRDLAQESERAFGADHEMREHVDGILEVGERIQAVPRRVLQPELVADARREGFVGARGARQRVQLADQPGLALDERRAARGVARVEHRSSSEHDSQTGERVVAVLGRPAAHAARIVGGDAAYHRRVDRRRIRTDLAAEGGEPPVRRRPDDTGLQGDRLRVVAELTAAPAIPEQHQNRIGDGLSRQARACRAKGDRRAKVRAVTEQPYDVVLAVHDDDDLRHEPIEACVRTPGEQAQGIGDQAVGGDVRR